MVQPRHDRAEPEDMVVGPQTVSRVPYEKSNASNDCAEYTPATFTIVSRLSANYRKLAQQCFNPTEGIISKGTVSQTPR
jgi:hypothetical protein